MVIVIIACYFSVKAFTFDETGSIGNLYELVKAAGVRNPVPGNAQGSFLTMSSKDVNAQLDLRISVSLTQFTDQTLRPSCLELSTSAVTLDW